MSEVDRKALVARIEAARTRGEQKRLGLWLDQQGEAIRREVIAIAEEAGVPLPPEAVNWPGKRLVRRARAREDDARERKNPIRVDEAFSCLACGADVEAGGARVRDHCPFCLHSLHVDSVPGDRASDCFGRLVPAALEHVGGEAVIQYLCDRCGHRHRCRAHSDDSQEALRALAGPRDPETAHRLKAIALPERVARFSEKEGLLQGRIGVAVSGGVDSMVLLHVLVELGHRPLVLSVDHGIRPESADELRGVEQEAKKLGLDFLGSSLSLSAGPDLALRAREARHAFFREADVDCVALAHHRDDQVETILDRLMRGAGAGGLGGMAPRRDHLVRPLLEESRAMIEAWAGLRSIDHFEDPSNKKGTRGRIRHELLPLMKELREGSSKSILRSAQHLQEDDQLLRAQAEALLTTDGLALHDWEQAPAPIKRRAVLALVRLARGDATDLGAAQLDQVEALSQPGGLVALSDGWRIVRDSRHLRCLPCLPEAASIKQGVWGLWQVSASKTVLLRSIETGEQGGGTPLRERLRAAGIGAALRPFHPLVEFEGRRWLPGVWLENQEEAFGVTVQCERPPRPSIPPGGPYTAAL